MLLIVEQFLNGLQFGLLLFLLAAGLTLVFGIMDFVNLAHGSLYMMGAYFAATFVAWTGNFVIGVLLALGATLLLGIVLEFVALRHLYGRDHLDHVLATFGLILFFNDAVRLIWGPAGLALPLPAWLTVPIRIMPGVFYPSYRLAIIIVSLLVAAFLYLVVMRTRIGMLIRAGASNREMIGALGINIKLLYTLVFGLGAALAGLAGLMQAPILTVQIGMGENILILGLRDHRDRRYRLDPRRIPGRDLCRDDRHARPRLPARFAAQDPERRGGFDRGACAVLDADLSADGCGAGGAAGGAFSGQPAMSLLNSRNAVAALVVIGLLLLPLYTSMSGNLFVLTLFTRIVIFALAAASLNLVMGYGGMMSFGHAAYLGIGGYAVGMLAAEGIGSGFIQWPVALAASALFALVIGALSLRTRGVYFIMITLAFAQMAYYVASGLARYGGDDGLTINKRSDFGGLINLSNRVQFYYLCLGCLFGGIYLIWRIVNSRFGMVVQGLRSNEQRMQAIGFPATRYRLVCFVISGTMCGLAGALLANNTDFVSPAVMYWTRSGDLMVMVILGGMGSLFGPVIGAVVYLVLEEFLSQVTEYWAMIMGPLLLLIVLFGRGGIDGLLGRLSRG